jgi:hypothetical protein
MRDATQLWPLDYVPRYRHLLLIRRGIGIPLGTRDPLELDYLYRLLLLTQENMGTPLTKRPVHLCRLVLMTTRRDAQPLRNGIAARPRPSLPATYADPTWHAPPLRSVYATQPPRNGAPAISDRSYSSEPRPVPAPRTSPSVSTPTDDRGDWLPPLSWRLPPKMLAWITLPCAWFRIWIRPLDRWTTRRRLATPAETAHRPIA